MRRMTDVEFFSYFGIVAAIAMFALAVAVGRPCDKGEAAMKEVEWAIQAKKDGKYVDVETFNNDNCMWNEPVDRWRDRILNGGWFSDAARRHGKSVRLVKRVVEQTVDVRYEDLKKEDAK